MICTCNQGRNPPCHCAECAEEPDVFDEILWAGETAFIAVLIAVIVGFLSGYIYHYYF